jgi:hypothetical protein
MSILTTVFTSCAVPVKVCNDTGTFGETPVWLAPLLVLIGFALVAVIVVLVRRGR